MREIVSEEQAQLWPYAEEQLSCIEPMLAHFVAWKNVLTRLMDFFRLQQKMEQAMAKEHGKLLRTLGSLEPSLGPGAGNTLKSWQHYAQFFEAEYASSESLIASTVLSRLKAVKTELKKRQKMYVSQTSQWKATLSSDRSKTMSCIAAHERNLVRRTNAIKPGSSSAQSGVMLDTDPWLTERVLHQQLAKMIDGENTFQQNMSDLVKDMSEFDAKIVVDLKQAMDDFARARVAQWTSMQTHMSSANALASFADPQSHFNAFVVLHRLDDVDVWQHPRIVDEFSYKVREIQILHHGILHIPGKIGKNTWTPVVAVLTETGYFHCFKITKSQRDQFVANKCQDENNRITDQGRTLGRERRPTSSSMIWPFSTLSRKQSANPARLEDAYNGLEQPSATLSMCLSQSRINFQLVREKKDQHVFEVVIQHRRPRSNGLFGLLAKPPSDTWTRYEFKATCEPELIEWLAVLQGKAKSYVPQGPPVEAMIKEHHARALSGIFPEQQTDKVPEAHLPESADPRTPKLQPATSRSSLVHAAPLDVLPDNAQNLQSPSSSLVTLHDPLTVIQHRQKTSGHDLPAPRDSVPARQDHTVVAHMAV
ncbi:hypothetical protein BC831DRAFT_458992, partial [Entophlyctis helioformis]